MSSPFDRSRDVARVFLTALSRDPELREDVQRSLSLLLTRYNTRIFENRFLVGGVAERIIAAAFVALGNDVSRLGVSITRTDIRVNDVHISVKGVFRPKARCVRLVNVMGVSASAAWNEPTLFVLAGRGIGYADPELLTAPAKRTGDALELAVRQLTTLWSSHPEYFLAMDIPFSREDAAGSDIASRIVADEILRYARRLRPFDPRTPEQ